MKHKNTAAKILNFLKQHEISWSQNELIQSSNVIPDSNIIKLVAFLFRIEFVNQLLFKALKNFWT